MKSLRFSALNSTTALAASSLYNAVTRWRAPLALGLLLCSFDGGFLHRANAATMVTFDVPGAGGSPSLGTVPLSINAAGTITGYFEGPVGPSGASGVFHGFLRAADGTFATVDAPGASGTFALSINQAGAITGYFVDANNLYHGFLRAAHGALITFDTPGTGTGSGQGTFPASISAAG